MTQLIIDGVQLPESENRYSADTVELYSDVEMVTGRLTRELRGHAWLISYQYGYFDKEMRDRVIAACNKGMRQPIKCGFLTQDSLGELKYDMFLVTKFVRPKFAWSRDGVPMWANFEVELRGVRPFD